MSDSLVSPITLTRFHQSKEESCKDLLAVEEPLEIRLQYGPASDRKEKTLSITMRTPGQDQALAAGFLWTEGLIRAHKDIQMIRHCQQEEHQGNVIKVGLSPEVVIDWKKLERHFYTSSSCGVCGKTSMEAVTGSSQFSLPGSSPRITKNLFYQMPELLQKRQLAFEHTGGLHAAGLFNVQGELGILQEDVGRHNALDKLIGTALLDDRLPLDQAVVLVSGRASFELIQKAYMAGIPILAAVGAPSSLAVSLAKEVGMTLIGFLRDHRFNVYTGQHRILNK